MVKELEASEIIAFCLTEKHQIDSFELEYKTIRAIAKKMEEKHPSLLVTSDMMSIDAFRCEFCRHVEMDDHAICIKHVKNVYARIQRYLPDEQTVAQLREVESEIFGR